MGRYKKVKQVRVNILEGPGVKPFGAFIKDGQLFPGFVAQDQKAAVHPKIVSLVNSNQCSCLLGVDSGGGIYYGTRKGGAALKMYFDQAVLGGFAFETREGDDPKVVALAGMKYATCYKQTPEQGEIPFYLYCGAIKSGRLFAGDNHNRYTLRWTGVNGWKDWEEGGAEGAGKLYFDPEWGYIMGVFDIGGELIVLLEFGVARLDVDGNPETFKIKEIIKCPISWEYSAVKTEDGLLFLTHSGLMRYRDGKVTAVEGLITDDATSPTVCSGWHGRFFFACAKSRSLNRSVVYVYDIFRDAYHIVDIPAYSIQADSTSVLAYSASTVYRLRMEYSGWNYEVISEKINFGSDVRKLATFLEVDCDPGVTVSVSNGRYTRTYASPDKKIRLNMRGSDFSVTFTGSTGGVRSAYLTAEVPE